MLEEQNLQDVNHCHVIWWKAKTNPFLLVLHTSYTEEMILPLTNRAIWHTVYSVLNMYMNVEKQYANWCLPSYSLFAATYRWGLYPAFLPGWEVPICCVLSPLLHLAAPPGSPIPLLLITWPILVSGHLQMTHPPSCRDPFSGIPECAKTTAVWNMIQLNLPLVIFGIQIKSSSSFWRCQMIITHLSQLFEIVSFPVTW
jgi:hypothetical protein